MFSVSRSSVCVFVFVEIYEFWKSWLCPEHRTGLMRMATCCLQLPSRHHRNGGYKI